MGLIREILGLGNAARDVAEVFTVNKTRNAEFEHLEHAASLDQFGKEFTQARAGKFNDFVDGLNRLPRPVLALGTVGLFTFAMANPVAFSGRMAGLDTVPSELWWLLGAIVSFYFGARELHHARRAKRTIGQVRAMTRQGAVPEVEDNAAVADWLKSQE